DEELAGHPARAAIGQDAALAELQDQVAAACALEESLRHRAHARVLVSEAEARLALVRRDEIEALKIQDIAPAVRHLTVGRAEHARSHRRRVLLDRRAMEDPVPEVAEDDDIRRVSLNGVDDLAAQSVGHDAVVDPVDLEHPMMIGDEPLLEGGGPAGVD